MALSGSSIVYALEANEIENFIPARHQRFGGPFQDQPGTRQPVPRSSQNQKNAEHVET